MKLRWWHWAILAAVGLWLMRGRDGANTEAATEDKGLPGGGGGGGGSFSDKLSDLFDKLVTPPTITPEDMINPGVENPPPPPPPGSIPTVKAYPFVAEPPITAGTAF
jgi:hypothetical protein